MTVFQGRDAAGTAWYFRGDGPGTAFMQTVGVVTAIPTVVGFEHQSVTSAGTLTNVGSAVAAGATHALTSVGAAGGTLKFREDGTNPTTVNGIEVNPGAEVEFTNLANVRVVAVSGTVVLDTSYRRYY